jgi:hypothetical protein
VSSRLWGSLGGPAALFSFYASSVLSRSPRWPITGPASSRRSSGLSRVRNNNNNTSNNNNNLIIIPGISDIRWRTVRERTLESGVSESYSRYTDARLAYMYTVHTQERCLRNVADREGAAFPIRLLPLPLLSYTPSSSSSRLSKYFHLSSIHDLTAPLQQDSYDRCSCSLRPTRQQPRWPHGVTNTNVPLMLPLTFFYAPPTEYSLPLDG